MKLCLLILLVALPTSAQTMASVDARARSVPDDEKPSFVTDSIKRMRAVLRQVLGKLEEARKTKDVVRLNCVNEKLTQIKGLLRISEQADLMMQESIERSERSMADNEFMKIGLARSKVDQLRSEAEQCVGELSYRAEQNMLVEVEVPADLPSLDPTLPGDPGDVRVRVPPVQPPDIAPLEPEPASPTL